MRSSSKGVQDVERRELIGLYVLISSRHPSWDGLEGDIVDETRGTFLVETSKGREATVPKAGQTFAFRVGDVRCAIRGEDIQFRPEDRTKKVKLNR